MDRIFPGQDQLRKQARTTQQDCESRAFAVVQSPLAIGDCHGPSLREPGAAPAAPNRYGLPCRSGGAGQNSGYLPQPMSTHGVATPANSQQNEGARLRYDSDRIDYQIPGEAGVHCDAIAAATDTTLNLER